MELTKLQQGIADNCKRVDVEDAYNDMLDECYSFDCVGGIFASMSPSRVLKECDPVAYRCGMNDWLDGEGFIEVNGDYYRQDDCESERDDLIEELENEVTDLEKERDELDADGDGEHGKAIEAIDGKITALLAEIKSVRNESL